jgi:hypothetical protein
MSADLRETRVWTVPGAREAVLAATMALPVRPYKNGRRWRLEIEGYENDWLIESRCYNKSTKRDAMLYRMEFVEEIVDVIISNEVYLHHNSGSEIALILLNAIDPTHEILAEWKD